MLLPPWNQIPYLILSNENIMQFKLWVYLEIGIFIFMQLFVAVAARNVYEDITYSGQNLSADMIAVNYNQNVIYFTPYSSMFLSSLFFLLFPCSLLSFVFPYKNDIQNHNYTRTNWCLSNLYLDSNNIQYQTFYFTPASKNLWLTHSSHTPAKAGLYLGVPMDSD